jgi:DNA polymerase-1
MLMSYALGGGRGLHSYEQLLEFYLNDTSVRPPQDGGITKARDWFANVNDKAEYVSGKAWLMLGLHGRLTELLFQNHKQTLYQKFDRPLSDIVYNMELTGIKLEKSVIQTLSSELDQEIEKVAIEIYKLAGTKFNIASPKQVSEVLFVSMNLPGSTKSKIGEYSTDIEALERLQAAGHTIADFLIKWRQLNKLKTSYTDSLLTQVDSTTGRIHTNFSIAYTITGRFGSTDPNLQNIPIKGEYGNVIRSAFTADDGWKIFSADYSQIELRILAHIANVRLLQAVFQDGSIDIHSVTASEVFGVPLNQVTSEMRRRAKAINFGIAYGMREHGLAKNLGISRIESSHYIGIYFKKYPEVLDYMNSVKKFAAQHGYVETVAGRRCYVPDINSKNGNARAFAERAAINAPIQGTNADIVRRAMVMLHDTVLSRKTNIRMLLQVHDELLFEIKEDTQLEDTVAEVKRVMESSHLLSGMPLKVNCTVGHSWSSV